MSGRRKQLLFAIVIALVAVFANKAYIDSRVSEYKPKKIAKLIRAKKGIPAGTPLRKSMLQAVNVPANFAPKVAISAKEIDAYLGQELTVDVPPRDYILENYFSLRRAVGRRLSDQVLGDNARAITLPVDQTDSLAGSIVTGDRIDLLYTFSVPGVPNKFSMLLMQNVPVIATGSYSAVEQELGTRGGRSARYNSLTLLVDIQDAVRLNFARQTGKLDILLRNSGDGAQVDIRPVSGVTDLLSQEQRALVDALKQSSELSDQEKERIRKQLQTIFESKRRGAGG